MHLLWLRLAHVVAIQNAAHFFVNFIVLFIFVLNLVVFLSFFFVVLLIELALPLVVFIDFKVQVPISILVVVVGRTLAWAVATIAMVSWKHNFMYLTLDNTNWIGVLTSPTVSRTCATADQWPTDRPTDPTMDPFNQTIPN